ncbi:hypothetical protein MNBD_CHLOROFLEXI01-3795, partial [hydrothermal vent metagenome]
TAVQLALKQLRKMVGAEVEEHFTGKAVVTNWSNDPFSRGAYSYALPKGSGARQLLQEAAVLKRVFFAGEALSTSAYGTAHGAYLSGQATAQRALKYLLNKVD